MSPDCSSRTPRMLDLFHQNRRLSTTSTSSNSSNLPQYSPLDTVGGGQLCSEGTDYYKALICLEPQPDLLPSPSYSTLVPATNCDASSVDHDAESICTLVAPQTGRRGPPRYSTVFSRDGNHETLSRLYPYSFTVKCGKKNRPWATLYLQDSRTDEQHRQKSFTSPRFLGSGPISGVLELDLESPQTVTSIKIGVKGKVITGWLDDSVYNILDHSCTIWDRSKGHPRYPEPGKPFDGKLDSGVYRFPFSFPFPTRVNLTTLTSVDEISKSPTYTVALSGPGDPEITPFLQTPTEVEDSGPPSPTAKRASFIRRNSWLSQLSPSSSSAQQRFGRPSLIVSGSPRTKKSAHSPITESACVEMTNHPDVYPLPSTFIERGVDANTRYELSLCISHGRLRGDSKLKLPITYTASSQPPSSSFGRQMAYREGTPLPGPIADPDGWMRLPSVLISGAILNQKRVEVECTLFLSQPLSYPRGTVIPCYMTLYCTDSHALDHLANPKAQHVRLSRVVSYCQSIQEAKTRQKGAGVASSARPFHGVLPSPPSGLILSSSTMLATTSILELTEKERKGKGKGRIDSFGHGSGVHEHPTPVLPSVDTRRCESRQLSIEIETAVWWNPPKSEAQPYATRVLEGEIHLQEELHPSSSFPAFIIDYNVELLAFQSALFTPDKPNPEKKDAHNLPSGKVYLSYPVTISGASRMDEPIIATFTDPSEASARAIRKRKYNRESRSGDGEVPGLTERPGINFVTGFD